MHLMLVLLGNVPVIIIPGILGVSFFLCRSFKITYNIEFCPGLGTAPLKPCPRYLVSSIGCHSDVMAAVPTVFSIAGSGAPGGNLCVSVLAD